MNRIYHHYEKWEEVSAGMWDVMPKEREKEMLRSAIDFTGNAKLYGSFMMRVVREWPISCEQALTNPSMNRLAWIGHAATCIAIQCPEYITRMAWGRLSQQQQDEANAEAQSALEIWLAEHRNGKNQMVFKFEVL